MFMIRHRLMVIFTILVIIITFIILFFHRNVLYNLSRTLGKTGDATQFFDSASLIVIPYPPNISQEIPNVTYQAIGILVPQKPDYLLKPLTNHPPPSVVVHSSHPLFISADRQFLKIDNQYIRLADWALVGKSEGGWELLRDDFHTSMNNVLSYNGQFSFSIGFSNALINVGSGDWYVNVAHQQRGQQKTLFLGLGKVQQAGWAPDQQSIYINNDGRILNVPLK